jgi:hypothetical protein
VKLRCAAVLVLACLPACGGSGSSGKAADGPQAGSPGMDAPKEAPPSGPDLHPDGTSMTADAAPGGDGPLPADAGGLDVPGTVDAAAPDAAPDASAGDAPAGAPDLGLVHAAAVCMNAEWCWQNPLPHGNTLYGVWGSSPRDVWTVGGDGFVVHHDGSGWTRVPVPTTVQLGGVWGSRAGDVWIVGDRGTVLRGDGPSWTAGTVGFDTRLRAIWGSGPDDVWAVGGDDQAESAHWDGTRWTRVSRAERGFHGIWGAGRDAVWAIGGSGVYRWTGAAWTSALTVDRPTAIWGSGPDDVWVVGENNLIRRWNGSAWTSMTAGTLGTRFGSVVGRGPNDVWIFGTRLHHWNGMRFTDLQPDGVSVPYAGAAIGPQLWVVGYQGMHLRHDGVAWADPGSRVPYGFSAVAGTSARDVWAAGVVSVAHHDGTQWSRVPLPNGIAGFKSLWASAPDDVWGVGDNGLAHWDGRSWYKVAVPAQVSESYLVALWGSAANDVWAVGLGGTCIHWDGQRWSAVPTGVSGPLSAVSGTGPRDVWAAGDWYILHWDGNGWTRTFDGALAGDRFGAIHAASPTEVWASGSKLLRWDGMRWDPAGEQRGIRAFAGRGNRPWALSGNEVIRWDGSSWQRSLSGTSLLTGLWAAPGGEVFTVGVGGAILARKANP